MGPATPTSRRLTIEAGALGAIIGALVVAPWTGSGYLLLLDWVSGPNQELTRGFWGLSQSAVDAMPFRVATQGLRELIGPAATAWFIIFLSFPLGAAGAAAAAGGSRWRRLPAAAFFVANPFILDRVRAGHVAVLLGLALLAWLFAAAVRARQDDRWFSWRMAFLLTAAVSISPHMAWLGGALLLSVALLPRVSWRSLSRLGSTLLAPIPVYGYAAVLVVNQAPMLQVTQADLQAYGTVTDSRGWFLTVLSLQGFWRDFPGAGQALPGWLAVGVFLVALLVLALGGWSLWRSDRTRSAPLLPLIVLGLLLGAGVAGPLAGLYRFALDHVPLFEAMREQQKWLGLVVLAFAVFFGAGVEALRERNWVPAVVAALVPAAVAPSLLWGLGGWVTSTTYPQGWYEANEVIGDGQELALFLPWRAYQPFPFTGERTVATPAAAFFSREVVVSDAVQLPGLWSDSASRRSAYLDQVIAQAGAGAFGPLLAPLGVRYVLLDKTGGEDYSWLAAQPGITLLSDNPDMAVYEVGPTATGRVVTARSADLDQAIAGYQQGWGSEAVLPPGGDENGPSSSNFGGLTRESPTAWSLAAGEPGWAVIPADWSPGWRGPDGAPIQPTLAGSLAVPVTDQPGTIEFQPWQALRWGYALSALALAVLVVGAIREFRADS